MNERIAVVGLGYVGLPVAVGMAAIWGPVIGFDIDPHRIADLKAGHDATGELARGDLRQATLPLSDDPACLNDASFIIVTVPTPIDTARQPDLGALRSVCATIGARLKLGTVVVFESTVYPGVTEEMCGPLLAEASGLRLGVDFTLGYSPERINPGDREHRLQSVVKIVAAQDEATLERIVAVYGPVVTAGLHRAPSIRVAEAAKVIENTQRDLNIALMNELAIIFERLGISTRDVLAAARTKWNFLPFSPGLVGGHCIGVDPYYLTAKAESTGYHPEVILAGRRINDGMSAFVARKLVKLLIAKGVELRTARVAILGLTFKEDVPDLRNSRVPAILDELGEFAVTPLVHDPLADPELARATYGIELVPLSGLNRLDAVVLAVPHSATLRDVRWTTLLVEGSILMDIRSVIDRATLPPFLTYWSL